MFDRYGRPLTNLRVMVTGRCNFSCFFCHMEGYRDPDIASRELSLEELELLASAARRLGVRAFKVTGGEPTLRRDLASIVALFKSIGAYVSLTTNASLLHLHLRGLVDAGLDHINVSLHAMRESVFSRITGSNMFRRVVDNIVAAREYGIPVKINFVILRGYNEDDVEELIDFAARIDARVQFIELHPVGKAAKRFRDHYLPRWRILERLENRIVEIKYRVGLHNRPIIVLDNGVVVEVVGPVGNYFFCAGCTRIRVTYDFKLIPCLNWKGEPIDVRERLKRARSVEEKVEAIVDSIREANRLREPYVLYPLKALPAREMRKWKTARLGLPKRDGRLCIPGERSREHIERIIAEWGDYAY